MHLPIPRVETMDKALFGTISPWPQKSSVRASYGQEGAPAYPRAPSVPVKYQVLENFLSFIAWQRVRFEGVGA